MSKTAADTGFGVVRGWRTIVPSFFSTSLLEPPHRLNCLPHQLQALVSPQPTGMSGRGNGNDERAHEDGKSPSFDAVAGDSNYVSLLAILNYCARAQEPPQPFFLRDGSLPQLAGNSALWPARSYGTLAPDLRNNAGLLGQYPVSASTSSLLAAIQQQRVPFQHDQLHRQNLPATLYRSDSSSVLSSLQQARQQAMAELEHVIHSLPLLDTADYLTAVRVAPHLVLAESDPIKFLQCCDFIMLQAAERLVTYWKRRCRFFGERAFLPMIATGDGALSERDIECLKNGNCFVLPNDSKGRTVVFYDAFSANDPHSLEAVIRSIFYVGQVACENEMTDGWVCLVVCRDLEINQQGFPAPAMLQLLTSFPFKLHSAHLFCVRQQGVSTARHIGGVFSNTQTFVHNATAKQENVVSMQRHGISPDGLPASLGGTWLYDRVLHWLQERTLKESELKDDRIAQLPLSVAGVSQQHLDSKPSSVQPSERGSSDSAGGDHPSPLGDDHARGKNVVQADHRTMMDLAIQQVSPQEKRAYVEAMQMTTEQLRSDEANLDWFLLVENLNSWMAAKRLLRYWQLRSDTFGPKRHHPLNQTGEGALERKELANLGTGFINILPHDSDGCPVIWIDSWRIRQSTSGECIDRAIFYMFSLLAENGKAQTKGATLLYLLDDSRFDSINVEFLHHLVAALPIRFKSVHLLSLGALSVGLEKQIKFGDEVRVHVGSSNEDLGNRLEALGMDRAGLPKRLKGDWGYEKFVQWQELRTRYEWKIPVGLSGRGDSADAFNFPAIRPYSVLSEEEKAERKRRMNVIHSRRKRDRERIEIDVLQEHCVELREHQVQLKQENVALEALAKSARHSK
jgi:hypothetical protein